MAHSNRSRAMELKTKELIASLPSFAKKYFSHLRDEDRSEETILQYAYDMQRFFDFLRKSAGFKYVNIDVLPADEVLDKLTIEDIQEYTETLRDYVDPSKAADDLSVPSNASVARRISSLRSFYKYYFRQGDIKHDLGYLMDVPAVKDKVITVLDKEDVLRLLRAVRSVPEGLSGKALKNKEITVLRDYAVLVTLLGTGLRVSELVNINSSNIDFQRGVILIVRRKGGDEDKVYIGPEVKDALLDYYENGRPLLYGENSGDAFFLSLQHRRMSVRNVEMLVRGYKEQSGISEKVTPHTCRRTYGTNLYNETNDIYLVATALHHASVETTKKHYAKVDEAHKQLAASKSSTLFSLSDGDDLKTE